MKAILISCTGKFCYRHGDFQNTEAASGGVLNFTGIKIHYRKHLFQSLFLSKVAGRDLKLYQERDSDTGVFLWTL